MYKMLIIFSLPTIPGLHVMAAMLVIKNFLSAGKETPFTGELFEIIFTLHFHMDYNAPC